MCEGPFSGTARRGMKMNFKVLVVDDEYYARKALVMMLEKSELPISVKGDFEDGEEVIEYLQENEADIIITDIRMPNMDGLELAKYVQEHIPKCSVVIETGYEDFQYARKALRYQVKEYLTKPINESELIKSIKDILVEKTKSDNLENMNRLKGIVENLDFAQLIQNKKLFDELILAEFWNDYSWFFMVKGEVSHSGYQQIKKYLQNKRTTPNVHSWYFKNKGECILLFFCKQKMDFRACIGEADFLQLKKGMDHNSWFGISGIHKERTEIEKAYRECVYAINNRILINENLFFWKEELEITNLLEKETLEIFSRVVEFGRISEAEKIIERLFSRCISEHANIYSLYNAIIQLFSVLRKKYYNGCQMPTGEGGYFLFDFKIDLYQFHTADELKEHLLMILKEVCEKNEENENELLIENILVYLENHYADDITLNELAEHKYFVSVGHLSRTFKNKTGLTFSKYLTEVRLKKAKEFLENTDFDITDIAAFTGYNDASYFTQIFRKSCGMTPSEYRSMERKNKKGNIE